MRVNYFGSLYFTKALLPQMVQQRRGWIVFVASVAGKIAPPEESAYAATKFAMVGLAASLSLEVEDAGVHVLTVCPGVIRTPFFDEEALSRMAPRREAGHGGGGRARRRDRRRAREGPARDHPSRAGSRRPT